MCMLTVELYYMYKHEKMCAPHWCVHPHVHNVYMYVELDMYIVCAYEYM